MLFNSYIFIFLFLPLALTGFYLLNYLKKYKAASIFLTCMSLWFYGYFNKSYLVIICGSIVVNYLLSRLVIYEGGGIAYKKIRKLVLVSGIIVNIAVIFYFKYFDFFIENINTIFGKSFVLRNIALPLGISFFTFQQISYLVDSYRGETKNYTFDEYALFVSFFPQLVAGPIVLHNEAVPQFRDLSKRHFIPQNFSKGMYVFSIGLFKKVIIADTFGCAVTYGFGTIPSLSSMDAILVSLSYTFQLYFDFSGYCDMASGIGSMFNVELPQNFNSPYKASSITDFWNRWHMSLTRFLKTYIYIPLGGNRKGKLRTYINIMAVYIVSGIWHGANWTFILWGIFHGFFNCMDRLLKRHWEKLSKITQWFITFVLIDVLWVIFRADSIASAKLFIKNMCSLSSFTINGELYDSFNLVELSYLEEKIPFLNYLSSHITGFNLWLFIFGAFFIVLNVKNSKEREFKPTILNMLLVVILIVWSVVSFAGISTFLYFDF